MTTLTQVDRKAAEAMWDLASGSIIGGKTLQQAAEALINNVHRELERSLALARVFVTAPYGTLPEFHKSFAANLAESNDVADQLRDETATLSLLATRGKENPWNDVKQSNGHVAIPLISGEFVGAIPMLSKLLQEFGVGAGLVTGGVTITKAESAMRSFFVPDASSAIDAHQRKIIPSQDFVGQYEVGSVFGIGGPYWEGSNHVLVCIFFATESIEESLLDNLRPLFEHFKSTTGILVEKGEIFS
jgi:hypothetical protein